MRLLRKWFGFAKRDPVSTEKVLPSEPDSVDIQVMPSHDTDPLLSDPNLAADLFDGVIAVFNDSLPGFISSSIDINRQRVELIAQLDTALRKRLATELANARLKAEQHTMVLSDRVQTLEDQVSELEAENQNMYSVIASRDGFGGVGPLLCLADPCADDMTEVQPANLRFSYDSFKTAYGLIELENKITSLQSEISQLHDERKVSAALVASLQAAILKLEFDNEELTKQIRSASDINGRFEQMRIRLEEAEETARQKDDDITDLNETIRANLSRYSIESARLLQRIEQLQSVIDQLTATPPAQEADEISADSEETRDGITSVIFLSDDIGGFSSELPPELIPRPVNRRKKRKRGSRTGRIEEMIKENDWFGTPDSKLPAKANNTDQLSLW